MWDAKMFGQGMAHDAGPKCKAYKEAKANYQKALKHLQKRAPQLPVDLEAIWSDFINEFPDWWIQNHKILNGNTGGSKFLKKLRSIVESLGRNCLKDPHKKNSKPRSKKEGDADAFANWMRDCIDEMKEEGGSLKLWL